MNDGEDEKPSKINAIVTDSEIPCCSNDANQLNESDSESSQKPIEKCPICLQKFSKSKSFAPKCFHTFCFECLLQWTLIKHSCPLCKRCIDRIIYDIKTTIEYKEYPLKPSENNQIVSAVEIIGYLPAPSVNNRQQTLINLNQTSGSANKTQVSKASWVVGKEPSPLEFRMLVYLNGWYANRKQHQFIYQIENLDEEFVDVTDDNHLDKVKPSSSNQEILVCNSYKPAEKFRETKPQWYSNNPSCINRLVQFIYRELKALAGTMSSSKSTNYLNQSSRYQFLRLLTDAIKKYDINSEEFLIKIKEFLNLDEIAKHFRHELSSFAISASHDLIDYDAKCVYYPNLESVNNVNNEDKMKIPFNNLPVNLSKYRLICKEIVEVEEVRLVEEVIESTTPSSVVLIDNQSSDTENSSYCEEIEPTPVKTPPLIYLSSSSTRSTRSRSFSPQLKRTHDSSDSSMPRCSSKKSKHRHSSSKKKSKKSKKKKKKKDPIRDRSESDKIKSRRYSRSSSPKRKCSRLSKTKSKLRSRSTSRSSTSN